MKLSRQFAVLMATQITSLVLPCLAQDSSQNNKDTPAVTGTGGPHYITVWKTPSELADSVIYQTNGQIGIGTTTPEALFEVNGTAQIDGNFQVNQSLYSTGPFGSSPILQVPNNSTNNFSAGLAALGNTASGIQNTAVGNYALAINESGIDNTAVGESALFPNSTGSSNTAVGAGALLNNTTGSSNTAVGASALQGAEHTTGNSNTAIGYAAGASLAHGSNNIYVANTGESTESGVTRIGTAGSQTATYIAGIYGAHTSSANAVPVVIDSNGNLGTVSSSRRYKEDIQDMANASDDLMRLRPVTFRYTQAYEDGSKPLQYGLIAEEVAEIYPDLVARTADGQVETVKYQLLDPMLLNELQRQNSTIISQQQEIRSLEDRLARIEAALGSK
jgi:hypothetical protein